MIIPGFLRRLFPRAGSAERLRLVVAQGPQQLLNACAVLRHLDELEPGGNFTDVLLYGHFYASKEQNAKMRSVCEEVSKLWGFARTLDVSLLERDARTAPDRFARATRKLRRLLAPGEPAIVLVANNSQIINQLVLAASPGTRRLCYGDSPGFLELDNTYGEPLYHPGGFPAVGEAWLITPIEVEAGRFEKLRLEMVPARHYVALATELGRRTPTLRALGEQIARFAEGQPLTLALTGNLTECGVAADFESEIELYLHTARPFLEPGERIIVKGHPRQTHGQAERLTTDLRTAGYAAQTLEGGSEWPAELLSPLVPIRKVLAFNSSTPVMLAWQQPCEALLGFDPEVMRRAMRANQQALWSRLIRVTKILTRQALAGEFAPLRLSTLDRDFPEVTDAAELLTPRTARAPSPTPPCSAP
jgi:hypothetical protein